MTCIGKGLDKKGAHAAARVNVAAHAGADLFGKSDPYFVIYKYNSDGSRAKAHTSDTIKNTLDPQWAVRSGGRATIHVVLTMGARQTVKVDTNSLTYGDFDRKLEVEVFDWDANSAHDLIGTFSVRVAH